MLNQSLLVYSRSSTKKTWFQIEKLKFNLPFFILLLSACSILAQSSANSTSPRQRNSHHAEIHSDFLIITFPLQGWYLVSLPLTVADSSVSTLFPTALGAFGWENNRYVAATRMQTGRGYWLLIPAPATAVISGTRLTQFRGHYLPGWHLIGSVMDTINFANPNDTPDRSVIVPIFAWSAGGQRYYSTTTIEQSYGHWMAVLQECDVIFKSDSSGAADKIGEGLNRQEFNQRFGASPPPPFALEKAALPTRATLFESYPNPFSIRGASASASTAIRYHLPEAGNTQVVIFNSLGQKIRTLAEKPHAAGFHEVRWDGRDDRGRLAASGVYYYRLTVNRFSQIKKLVLVQ